MTASMALRAGVLIALALTMGCMTDDEAEPDAAVGDPPCGEGVTEACLVDGAACVGRRTCVDGVFSACAAPAEACNGVDDDCDGATDEDFADLGEPCEGGAGRCRDAGRRICAPDGADTICDAIVGDGGAEACNGVDDDCDGTTDEDTDGAPCATGLPGLCADGARTCVDGDALCAPAVEPAAETCDGRDEDCDGHTDEAPAGGPLTARCYDGPEGTEGIGACAAGASTCADGAPGACVGQVLPADEVCDSVDNDCDGIVDEVDGIDCACDPGEIQRCYAGPGGTDGIGVCRAGTRTCLPDGSSFGPCVGEVLPGVDLCSGADEDCDGEVDEQAPALDAPCTVGVGACAVAGTRICDPARGGVICDAEPGVPSDELCNGIDDDCDGIVDDVDGVGTPCRAGEGACAAPGALACDADGALTCDARPTAPGTEACDGIDNDCDGIVDDVAGRGDACAVGEGLCRSTGIQVCDLAAEALVCGATAQAPGDELCAGGLDEDCDGDVDEAACVAACDDDADCAEGVCVDGRCGPAPCVDDGDCAPLDRCDAGACVPDPAEGALRLVDGEAAHVGRLEVQIDGVWGTVCDDGFELPSAEVACLELGFAGAARVIGGFGGGLDPIWLDEVSCVGDEPRLIACPADPIGVQDCAHDEDVGLECLRACAERGQCLDGEVCADGLCAPGDCLVDGDCAPGEACVERACRPVGPDPRALCQESCDDIEACLGLPDDPSCVDGCMATPQNQTAGACVARGLDPAAGLCDPLVIVMCNQPT